MADEHTASAVPNAASGSSQDSEAAANKKFLDADELAAKVSNAMFLKNLSKRLQKEAEQRKFAASKRTSMSKEEFLQKAREDAYAAEGDRIADAKQKQIEGIENARMYSARRAQEEEQIMAEEVKFEKGDYNATDNQRAFLSKIYDRLHPYHKAHIDKEMLDGCARDEYKLSSKMVNEAIATSTALNFLKYHMVPEDLEKLTVQEALSKQKDFENKPNLKMIANMKAAGIKYDENTTFEQAKELLNNRPITERQFEMLRNRVEGAEKLTCGEARQIMDKLQRDYKDSLKQPVSEAIRKVAIENKLIKGNSIIAQLSLHARSRLHTHSIFSVLNVLLKTLFVILKKISTLLLLKHSRNTLNWLVMLRMILVMIMALVLLCLQLMAKLRKLFGMLSTLLVLSADLIPDI